MTPNRTCKWIVPRLAAAVLIAVFVVGGLTIITDTIKLIGWIFS